MMEVDPGQFASRERRGFYFSFPKANRVDFLARKGQMKKLIALVVLSGYVSLASFAQIPKAPSPEPQSSWALKFEDFPATAVFKGKPAAVKIKSRSEREFRTRLRDAARAGPNFAGHYTIAEWGCGSGCLSIVVIDSVTGVVYWSSSFSVLSVPYTGAETGSEYQGVVYRLNSRLLVADGCPGEAENPQECGTHYYEWRNHQLKLVRFDKVPPKVG